MWSPRLADTVYVLDHGEVIAQGTPDEVRRNEEVLRAYLGRNAQASLAGTDDCRRCRHRRGSDADAARIQATSTPITATCTC